MTPRALVQQLARKRPERAIQAAVLAVFRAHGILCWGVNRERAGFKRASHVGFAGHPDIAGVLPNGRALFCEVKRPGEKLAPHQVAAMQMLSKQGAFVCWVRSVNEARDWAMTATGGTG